LIKLIIVKYKLMKVKIMKKETKKFSKKDIIGLAVGCSSALLVIVSIILCVLKAIGVAN